MNRYKDFEYDYTKNTSFDKDEDFYSQKYEDREDKSVDAIYTPPVSKFDKGNIFIEALPRMRSKDRLELDVNQGIDGFSHRRLKGKSLEEQTALLLDLYKLRFVLPNQHRLEGMFSNILTQVYRSRNYKVTDEDFIFQKDKKQLSNLYAYGKVDEAPPVGFSLLGYAGCGKTSMIGAVLKHYPQVIRHADSKSTFPQITYIMSNSNTSSRNDFNTVLNDICRQIDIALGIDEGLHYKEAIRLKTYDKKIGYIKRLITMYNIGAIIIDEIQNLDFRKNDKETYSKLLQISNETNVAFIMVGTEQAYDRMFSDLHMHRRFPPIIASTYVGNIRFLNFFLRKLLEYQWFDEEVKIPDFGEVDPVFDSLVEAFYETTNGIIALVINLYEKVNFDYLLRKTKPDINGEYVRKVFNRYFGSMANTIDSLDRDFSYAHIQKSIQMSNKRKEQLISQIELEKEIESKTSQSYWDENQKRANLMNNMIRSISMCMGDVFTDTQISNACKSVVGKSKALEMTEQELTAEAIKKLNTKPKNPRKPKPLPESLQGIIDSK